jgi:hypothetical protein
MAKIEQFSRLINHRITTAGQQFTIPTSNDHTDETWLSTDLYIGELGMNITDDKLWFRTNNGLVQIATGTSSGGSTASQAAVWVFNSPNINIGSTYSADSVSPRSGYYTDLGTSTLPWKDLYLGGSSTFASTIKVKGSLYINSDADEGVLSTGGVVSTNSPIEIHTNSSNVNKDRVLWLNTRYGSASGSTNYIGTFNSQNVAFTNNTRATIISGYNAYINDGVTDHVHLGKGFNKTNYNSDQIVAGGSLAVRGVDDDGSTQYNQSDWITTQTRLRTSNALTTAIASIPWIDLVNGGEVMQVKAYLIGTDINDASKVYSAEIMGVYSLDSNLDPYEIGTPILNAVSSYTGTQPDVEMDADDTYVYIKVTGFGTNTIQWLCTYSYHRLINVY